MVYNKLIFLFKGIYSVKKLIIGNKYVFMKFIRIDFRVEF